MKMEMWYSGSGHLVDVCPVCWQELPEEGGEGEFGLCHDCEVNREVAEEQLQKGWVNEETY